MNLDWDKNTLIKCRDNLLQKSYTTGEDIYLRELYDNYIFNGLIEEFDYFYDYDIEDIINKIDDNIEEYNNFFSNLPSYYKNNLINLIDGCKYSKISFTPLKNDSISNQQLVNTSYEIFSSISLSFIKYIDYIYKEKLVKVDYTKETVGPCCFLDLYNKKGFVYITNFNKMSKESVFNHELTHSIMIKANNDFININQELFEYHSSFLEIYTDRYLYNKTKDKKYLISSFNLLVFLKKYINEIKIINSLSKINILNKDNIINQIKKDFNIDISYNFTEFFNNYFKNYNIFEDFKYLLSICCSLDLLNKDEQDFKIIFTNLCFNEFSSKEDFLKETGFNLNNNYYMYDILDKNFREKEVYIRKLK